MNESKTDRKSLASNQESPKNMVLQPTSFVSTKPVIQPRPIPPSFSAQEFQHKINAQEFVIKDERSSLAKSGREKMNVQLPRPVSIAIRADSTYES